MESTSVAICTRNRGDTIVRAIRSILACDHRSWELCIVDQSDDERTADALVPFLEDRRIRYRRSRTVGIATARNLAAGEARSELIAYTDDDCEVAADWLRELEAAFAVDERIGIVFGNVLAGPHDAAAGFVPAYVQEQAALARRLRDKNRVDGAGACMALRRSAWRALGGFDETLGCGAHLLSGEETDLTIRALRTRVFAYHTPRARVTHHGFYPWAEHRAVMERYWYGTGAAFARSFAAEPAAVARVLFGLAARWATKLSPVAASLHPRAHRLARLSAFARGFVAGLVAGRRPCSAFAVRAAA
jgi:glycosyltransferase involved in cell wall biosynthesis